MKKPITIFTTVVCVTCSALALIGCNSHNTKFTATSELKRIQTKTIENDTNTQTPDSPEIDTGMLNWRYEKPIIFGVRRRFMPHHYGTYSVEYVRFPQGEKKDETLDYRLTLNQDDTFEFTVVTNGVTAEHNGHYYIHRDGYMTLYYDEEIEQTAHNVYVSDSLYCELLPSGKIMFYDNCNMIVLARDGASIMPLDTDQSDKTGGNYYYDDNYDANNGGITLYMAR